MPHQTMIRRNPLQMEPNPTNIEERPLNVKEIKEKAYPKV